LADYRSLKYWFHAVGSLLGLLGVVFVVLRLFAYAGQISFSCLNITAWSIIGLMVLVYGAANVLLARAWWHLLAFFEVKANWQWALKTYGLSQVAKYIPGNIFHLAGRQALGMAVGLPARPLAKSALWEVGMLAIGGALFGVLAIPLVWVELSPWLSAVLFLVMTGALFAALRQLLSPSVAAALIWQMAFLFVSAAMFIGILKIVAPSAFTLPVLITLCGAYVIAWLAGFVTPGAPAGMGIREVVLLFLLGVHVGQAELLMVVVLGRAVTVIGDLFYFMVATLLLK